MLVIELQNPCLSHRTMLVTVILLSTLVTETNACYRNPFSFQRSVLVHSTYRTPLVTKIYSVSKNPLVIHLGCKNPLVTHPSCKIPLQKSTLFTKIHLVKTDSAFNTAGLISCLLKPLFLSNIVFATRVFIV